MIRCNKKIKVTVHHDTLQQENQVHCPPLYRLQQGNQVHCPPLEDKIFENCILKTHFLPRDLLMQHTGTVRKTLVVVFPGIIPVKFDQNPMSGFRGEDV